MIKIRHFFLVLFFAGGFLSSQAQIGYQVSLLNNATGEPRANERVSITVKITDSEGKTVCEETKNETSNDFGVISMSVGNNETFSNADWSKLPFFIEASIDGRLIGKSQLLSVPVAEYAKHTGFLSKELLCSKEWEYTEHSWDGTANIVIHWKYIFNKDGSYTFKQNGKTYYHGTYFLDGNEIHYSQKDNGTEYWGYSLILHPTELFLIERGSHDIYK